ncbi:regulator of protease activity HflC (stomatin/prohibitin superfamily) [Sphingomonas sp. BE123]|uniref:membrane protease subunit n=1 Tax=Sphingomonas sp. BE123 TaxID=2817842 RepID=UPI00286422D3|nr:membrane protease subunit [Sphingomonas sp. BE123]MDR6851279.1 regulator of protease activity HflC (stomatin/prohibitin superfamily) [Sphingomonas sp. BE123]
MNGTAGTILKLSASLAILLLVIVGGGLGSCAAYNSVRVWNAETAGEAELAQATQNRKIKVLEAQAKMDSAALEANAEIARAKGLAEAKRIVANSLGGPEGYLRYLYIQNLEQSQGQIIYVPTEGGLPILEAGRLQPKPAPAAD